MILNTRKTEPSTSAADKTSSSSYSTSYAPPPVSNSAYGNAPTSHSIVDIHLTMKGDLESDGDVLVKGKVIGNIKCKLLIIDIDATVDGGVEAEEVVIRGKSKGTIQANRVKLEKTANVDSEIEHNVFSAEEGAKVKGALRYKEEPMTRKTVSTISLVA